jgi:hypothetical protein
MCSYEDNDEDNDNDNPNDDDDHNDTITGQYCEWGKVGTWNQDSLQNIHHLGNSK